MATWLHSDRPLRDHCERQCISEVLEAAKTGPSHGSMYCGLGTSRPRAAAAACATGLYGRLYGIRLYFAVFRCMTLHTCDTHRHAFPPAPYSHTAPYSAIQRCMSIQLYSTIQHTPHTTPLRPLRISENIELKVGNN